MLACGPAAKAPTEEQQTIPPVTMKDVEAAAPSLLVATKIERPLYIVVTDERVKDVWDVDRMNVKVRVTDFQLFVTRDLKKALEPYFVRVETVSSATLIPAEPHIVADVKVTRIKSTPQQVGILTYLPLEMTWSFAIRPSELQDYAFSYAGENMSTPTFKDMNEGLGQLVEGAITGMLSKWTEKNGISELRQMVSSPGSASPPQPPPPPKDGARAL
jgi:hypothetical protein